MFKTIVKLYMTIKNNNDDGSGGFPGSWVIHKSDAKSKKMVIRKLLQAAASGCRKLPLISQWLYIFVRGFRRAYKRTGFYPGGGF